jgi:hypothetical protein
VIAYERVHTPSAYVPPGVTPASAKASVVALPSATQPLAVASAAAPAPAPAPPAPAPAPAPLQVATAPSVAAPSGTTGTITVGPGQGGHRVWIDKHIVGESPGTFTVRCGWRSVQVGSQGYKHQVNIPCGGDIQVH